MASAIPARLPDFNTVFTDDLVLAANDCPDINDAVTLFLNTINNLNPGAPSSPSASIHRLAIMVRAGGNDPVARRIAGLVLHSKFIHDAESSEDISTFCAAASRLPLVDDGAPAAASQAVAEGASSVPDVKVEMREDKVPVAPSFSFLTSKLIPFLGAPLGCSIVIGLGAVAALLFGGPVGAALGATLGILAGAAAALTLIGLAVIVGMALFRRHVVSNEMARARDPADVAKIFHRLSFEAQAYLLDRLGSTFRKEVVRLHPNDRFVREFKGLFDVFDSSEASPALKRETYEKVISQWERDVDRFGPFVDRAKAKALQAGILKLPSAS